MTYSVYRCKTCGTRRISLELMQKHEEKTHNGMRCPQCRTWRATWKAMQAHIKKAGHYPCTCGGYHYAHRRGSPFCYDNPKAAFLHAARATDLDDESLMELLVELVWDSDGEGTDECPF